MATVSSANGAPNTFEGFWGSDELSDVVFMVGEESRKWRIAAHKLVLSKCSPVFHRMFHGSLKESTEKDIIITDVQPEIFDLLLRFLYTSKLDFDTVQEAIFTYQAAHKYEIKSAMKICVQYLCSNVNAQNFFDVYNFMELYMEEPENIPLQIKFGEIIDRDADEVLKSLAFLSAKGAVVLDICARGTLKLSSEVVLFEALVRWASAECKRQHLPVTKDNKRKVLDEILFNIRFGLLSPTELSQGPMKSGLLKEEDKKKFISNVRLTGSFSTRRLEGDFTHDKVATPQEHWLSFVFDRNVILTSVVLTANKEMLDKDESLFKIYHQDNILVEMSLNIKTMKEDKSETYILNLDEPLYIQPQKRYILYTWIQSGPRIIQASTPNPTSSWFDGIRDRQVVWDVDVNLPGCQENGTSINTGQLFGLNFVLPLREFTKNK